MVIRVSLIIDKNELWKFISWLPPLEGDQAYEVVLMIRSTGLRDKYGFKGSDHKLMSKVVHGYLSSKIRGLAGVPMDEIELWRYRLYEDIERMGILGKQGRWSYIKYKSGSNKEIETVYDVPHELLGLLISINPSSIMKASLSTIRDIEEAVWSMASGEGKQRIRDFFRRPDERYHANIMKHMMTRIHTIDIDDMELSKKVLGVVRRSLGFTPPVIRTRRGIHILVNMDDLKRRKLIEFWIGGQDKRIPKLVNKYKYHVKGNDKKETLEKIREELEAYVWNSEDPLFHRLVVASVLYKNNRGGSLVEVKKKPLEPIPGTLYKGIVVKFYRENEFNI